MIDRFEKLLGKKKVSNSPEELKKYSVAGKIPSLILFPTSIDQISEIMKSAKRDGKKLLIAGNNSQHSFGSAIETLDWCISLNRMNKIVEHEAADLIINIEPGVTLPQLQKFLNKGQQFLPLDPMGAQNRTLGGIVATNHSGPLRLLYGTCRDLVLGMKVVLPDATVIRAGGKTVKNVAGYDLSKLFIGSLGTLGVIAEITFKLFPLPARSETLWATYNQFDEIPDLIQSIGASNLVVSRCEYLNRIFIEKYMDNDYGLKGMHHILFDVQGNAEMMKTTVEKMHQLALEKGAQNIQLFSKKDSTKLWNQISSLTLFDKKSESDHHCQISIPKASFGSVINSIENFSNNNMLLSLAIQAHAGSRIIDVFCGDWNKEQMSPDRCRSQIESLRQIVKNQNGNMVIWQAPDSSREPAMIWGEPGYDFHLMKKIKTSYDQHQIFVAGRFIGGL